MLLADAMAVELGKPLAVGPRVHLPMAKGGADAGRRVDRETADIARRYALQKTALRGGLWIAGVLASWVPINALRQIVVPFAGKNTDITVNIVVGVTITLGISLTFNAVQWLRGRERVREINRQRERADRYETERGIPVPPRRKEK